MKATVDVQELLNYTLNISMHSIDSLSKILSIPKKRLLQNDLMTQKDLATLDIFKKILKK